MTCWVNLGGKENVERASAGENSTLPPRVSAGAKWLADHGTTSDGQIATQVDTRVLQLPHVGAEKETKHTETSNVRAERVCITDAGNGAPRGVGVKGRWRKKEGLMPAM